MKNKVTSLELSKKLKELGVEQEIIHGDWVYVYGDLHLAHNDNDTGWFLGDDYSTRFDGYDPVEYIRAFLSCELGEMLPEHTLGKDMMDNLHTDFKWWVEFEEEPLENEVMHADTEANARAKMLIYLKENKLI